jgi:hypothetical protein
MNTFTTSISAFNLSDPFGPVAAPQRRPQPNPHPQNQPQQQQQQPSFANFDNNPIFSSAPVVSSSMTTSASFPSTVKPPRPPAEDKYAALKDLDSLMKMQQETQNQPSMQG